MVRRVWRVGLVALVLLAARAGAADYRLNVIVELPAGEAESFEQAWVELRDVLQARGYPYYTVVSESGPYRHFVCVMEEYAALETIEAFRAGVEDDTDASVRALVDTLTSNAVSAISYISRHDRELSYAPPGSYSGPYHRLQTFSFTLDRRAAMESAFRALNAAWGEAEIPSAFHVTWHGIGAGGGEVTMLTSAPTPGEHALREANVRAATGEAYQAFDAALWSTVESSRIRYWLSRPELTLKPIEQ